MLNKNTKIREESVKKVRGVSEKKNLRKFCGVLISTPFLPVAMQIERYLNMICFKIISRVSGRLCVLLFEPVGRERGGVATVASAPLLQCTYWLCMACVMSVYA